MPPLRADSPSERKSLGSFYTPPEVADMLVRWVVRSPSDRLLDPACGNGRFLTAHSHRRQTSATKAQSLRFPTGH